MTDRDALYRAILDDPDDDTPRLVYADALDENGDPEYARFIRTQIELARVPDWDPLAVRYKLLAARGRSPAAAFARHKPPLPDGLTWFDDDVFRRGFSATATAFGLGPLLAGADALFAAAPIDGIDLGLNTEERPDALARLAGWPGLARVRRLHVLNAVVDAEGVRHLQRSRYAAGLTDLDLTFSDLTADGLAGLFRRPLVARLRSLALDLPRGSGGDLARLAHAAGGPYRLRSIRLVAPRGVADPLRAETAPGAGLFDAPLFRGLTDLYLGGFPTRTAGARALDGSPLAATLESLSLGGARIGINGLRALARSPALAGLRRLRLTGTVLPAGAAAAVARSPHLAGLRVLYLTATAVDDPAARALLDAPLADGLLDLVLPGGGLGAGMRRKLQRRFGDRLRLH